MDYIKKAYLIHAIEFTEKPEPEWVQELKTLLWEKIKIICTAPLDVTYCISNTATDKIRANREYAALLKRNWHFEELKEFMSNVWAVNKASVDESSMLITLARTENELKLLSNSGGSFRELHRAYQQGKPCYLVCECGNIEMINSHFCALILEGGGKIFRSRQELVDFLKQEQTVCKELK